MFYFQLNKKAIDINDMMKVSSKQFKSHYWIYYFRKWCGPQITGKILLLNE